MFQKISTVLIWSSDFRKLAEWYQKTFDLKVVEEIGHPQDTGILFGFPDGMPWIWIGQHSEISGMNKDPLRNMFNINVTSVTAAFEHLKKSGATIIAEPFKAPTFDKWFVTAADPEGNVFQVIGPKGE
jgi:predicted enzyme related to lactoylglutathione lyase